jgi:hypothetical protein
MKKSMWMVLGIGLVAFGGFNCRAEVTYEMIQACNRDVQAILALLPQAESQSQTNLIHSNAIKANASNRENAVAFAKSLGACGQVVSDAALIQAIALGSEKDVTLAAKAHFEAYGGSSWKRVNVRHLTTEEAIEFYTLVLKNTPLTEKTKDDLGKVKGDLLKLKDM